MSDKKNSEVCMARKVHVGKRGFTLVELLIVIIIIAVLAAIAIPRFADSSTRSKESALRAELRLLRNAIELFRNDTGVFPAALADLAASTAPATGRRADGSSGNIIAADFKGPYVTKISTDPVSGSAFTYSITSPNVGRVTSSATGNGSDGTAYNTW
jgi:general secretion pathway protein G